MSKLQKKFTDQFQEEMDESVGGVERNKDGEKIQVRIRERWMCIEC